MVQHHKMHLVWPLYWNSLVETPPWLLLSMFGVANFFCLLLHLAPAMGDFCCQPGMLDYLSTNPLKHDFMVACTILSNLFLGEQIEVCFLPNKFCHPHFLPLLLWHFWTFCFVKFSNLFQIVVNFLHSPGHKAMLWGQVHQTIFIKVWHNAANHSSIFNVVEGNDLNTSEKKLPRNFFFQDVFLDGKSPSTMCMLSSNLWKLF